MTERAEALTSSSMARMEMSTSELSVETVHVHSCGTIDRSVATASGEVSLGPPYAGSGPGKAQRGGKQVDNFNSQPKSCSVFLTTPTPLASTPLSPSLHAQLHTLQCTVRRRILTILSAAAT
eukprot:1172921-Rhodomonas_salina.1